MARRRHASRHRIVGAVFNRDYPSCELSEPGFAGLVDLQDYEFGSAKFLFTVYRLFSGWHFDVSDFYPVHPGSDKNQ